MATVEIPNKLYFRIGEVAKIVDVKPYVLRYWETEFAVLKPEKTASRHRLYRRHDVELLLDIKRLLYQEGFTISGAKKRLKDVEKKKGESAPVTPAVSHTAAVPIDQQKKELIAIRNDLLALYKILDADMS